MKKGEVCFGTPQKFNVSFDIDETKFSGVLFIADGHSARLQVNNDFFFNGCLNIAELKCFSSCGASFTLLNCEGSWGVIYPSFILKCKDQAEYDAVVIDFLGLVNWFDLDNPFSCEHDKIFKQNSKKQFEAVFSHDNVDYSISNSPELYTNNRNPDEYGKTIVYEYQHIVVKRLEGNFSLEEVVIITRHLKILFTLLSGHAVHIHKTSLKSGSSYHPFYFPEISSSTPPSWGKGNILCTGNFLFEADIWEPVLKSYFDVSSKSDLFINLYETLIYDGIWTNSLLMHVSTLDSYCTYGANGMTNERWDNDSFKKTLDSELESFKHNSLIGTRQCVNNIIRKINDRKKQVEHTFEEKFNYVLEETNSSIKKIIGFDLVKFKQLKNARNCIAHGGTLESSFWENISTMNAIKNNLQILLLYFAFKELSFSEKQFALCLKDTYNKISQFGINMAECNKFLGYGAFIALSEGFEKLPNESYFSHLAFIYDKLNNTYRFDEELTKLVKQWYEPRMEPRKHRSIVDYLEEVVEDSISIKFENLIYLEKGNEYIPINGGVILTK